MSDHSHEDDSSNEATRGMFGDIRAMAAERRDEEEAAKQRLRTAAGIHAQMNDEDGWTHETPGPEHYEWKQAVSVLIEDITNATLELATSDATPEPLQWHRAVWAFTWPLNDATQDHADSPCRIRIWTSTGIPENYQVAHDSTDSQAFNEAGARLAALRAWDATRPWNTYLVHVQRTGPGKPATQDCAWWEPKSADHFAKPDSIVSALARIFPAKGWPLAPTSRW